MAPATWGLRSRPQSSISAISAGAEPGFSRMWATVPYMLVLPAASADSCADLILQHRTELDAEFRRVLVLVHRDGVFGGRADNLVLLAGDGQCAIALARELPTVRNLACHGPLLQRGALKCRARSPRTSGQMSSIPAVLTRPWPASRSAPCLLSLPKSDRAVTRTALVLADPRTRSTA